MGVDGLNPSFNWVRDDGLNPSFTSWLLILGMGVDGLNPSFNWERDDGLNPSFTGMGVDGLDPSFNWEWDDGLSGRDSSLWPPIFCSFIDWGISNFVGTRTPSTSGKVLPLLERETAMLVPLQMTLNGNKLSALSMVSCSSIRTKNISQAQVVIILLSSRRTFTSKPKHTK